MRVARWGDKMTEGGVKEPRAMKEAVEHVIHGDRRVDHYAWMRKKEDPRVIAYLNEENAYAEAMVGGTGGLQEKLYEEMLGRILQTDLSVPYVLRGYSYFTRTEEGKQYPIYCRRKEIGAAAHGEKHGESLLGESAELPAHFAGPIYAEARVQGLASVEAAENAAIAEKSEESAEEVLVESVASAEASWKEEVLLDLNVLAEGHSFLGLGVFEVSDDNWLLAFATDRTGYRQYTLEVKDLRDGSTLPFRAERVTSAAWAADNRTLFYVVEDEQTKRSHRLYRHVVEERVTGDQPPATSEGGMAGDQRPVASVGEEQSTLQDELIYEERDERFRIGVGRTRSGAYLLLMSASHTTSEVRYLRADQAAGAWKLIEERIDEHEYYVDHHPGGSGEFGGGVFFIRTNSGGRTFRLVNAPTNDPRHENWHEAIANRNDVMLAGVEVFRTHMVLVEREDGLPCLRIVDLTRQAASALEGSWRIEFAEPAYNASLGANPEFESGHVRFVYESFITPKSVYDLELRSGERVLREQQPDLGGYDAGEYGSDRIHAIAADGTRVPLSVVYRKETPRDGNAPLLLYGYGSYGLSMPVSFNSNRLSLLDRGFIYAIAHIRGGGEMGKPWHDAGRMRQKMNTFTDFISCAEHLIAKRYTSHEKLAIEGGSAGGLLMGAVTNMRPELFRVVVSHVPFVDVLNTMLDASLPLTVGEFEEWGNPQEADDYFYMRRYCPYTNVERKEYPVMLVKTGLNDSQVMYWEPAKYVARLREMKTDGKTLVFKINMGAGHGGASGRYDYLREIAFDYAFLLREMGVE